MPFPSPCVSFTTCVLLLATESTPETVNLLRNPGFENGEPGSAVPGDWTVLRGNVAWIEGDAHSGRRFVRLTDRDPKSGTALRSALFPARPGGTYRLSGYLRVHDQCAPGLYIEFFDAIGKRVLERHERLEGPTEGWQRLEVTAVAPEEAVQVSALVYSFVADRGTVDADDLRLTVTGGRDPGVPPWPHVEPESDKPAISIGSRRELFIDDVLIGGVSGDAARRLHHPCRMGPALVFDRPWEGRYCGYVAVVVVAADDVRLYYRGWPDLNKPAVTCCAVSRDGGRTFTRPDLGLYEFDGSKHNNIVYMGPGTHNFTPFLDANPDAPQDQRFKALASAGPKSALVPFVSADGFRWRRLTDHAVITDGAFDSQNLAFWDPVRKRYAAYFRDFRNGVRDIKMCTSTDFIHWTKPVWLSYGDAPKEHLYTNAVMPYPRAPHILIGFPCRFVPHRKKIASHAEQGMNDGVLMSSRDGVTFQRWVEAFLRPGPDPLCWTDRNNYIAWGLAPSENGLYSLYWNEHYRYPTHRLQRGVIRVDGFASLHAGADGGEVLTRPVVFEGTALEINYATSAVGWVRVEICDEKGTPFDGFRAVDCSPLFGNEIAGRVAWGSGASLGDLAGRPVRLRFLLKDADVYSFRFFAPEPGR